jgi:hypothetical protein
VRAAGGGLLLGAARAASPLQLPFGAARCTSLVARGGGEGCEAGQQGPLLDVGLQNRVRRAGRALPPKAMMRRLCTTENTRRRRSRCLSS